MPFAHGKTARMWVDDKELTSYFNEFTMAAKAGVAETTVFGRGAKTFIGGIKEGTISGKGFFDANVFDVKMTNLLGSATNMAVTFSPNGAVVDGSRVIVAYAAETDYAISVPVTNVVATSFAAQADSGLSTGVMLYNPDRAAVTTSATFGNPTAVTLAAAMNTKNTGFSDPAATWTTPNRLDCSAVTNFNAAGGVLIVATSTTPAVMAYTGVSGNNFTGVTILIPGGAMATGGNVNQGLQPDIAAATTDGLVGLFHLMTLTGTSVTPKIQHSADGNSWVDLVTGAAMTVVGSQALLVAANIPINQYLRLVYTTTAVTSTTFLASVARQ